MNSYKTAVAIAIGTLFAGAAFAQSNYDIEQRDRAEQARINRGIESGQLTSREADRLQGERAQIERMERRARADGVLTRNERARIDGAQDRLGRDIYRETHDRQTASNNGGHNGWDRGNGWGRGNDNGRGHDFGRGYDNRRGHDFGRGNDNGRGHDFGRGNDNGRGHDFGRGNDHRQFGNRDGGRGEHNTTHAGNTTPGTGTTTGTSTGTGNSHGWTPRTGTQASTGQSDRSGGRQASMPQAQPRSTPTRDTRTVTASAGRQGGDSGRRTR